MGKLMPLLMLTTDTTATVWDTEDTTVDTTDIPMVDTATDTGSAKLKLKPNPRLPPMLTTDTTATVALRLLRIPLRLRLPWILRLRPLVVNNDLTMSGYCNNINNCQLHLFCHQQQEIAKLFDLQKKTSILHLENNQNFVLHIRIGTLCKNVNFFPCFPLFLQPNIHSRYPYFFV